MNERIKQLAEQAGLLPLWVCVNESTGSQMIKPIDQDVIERFVELVRQDGREKLGKPTLFYGRAVYFADPQTGEVKQSKGEQND
jgi:hypothetical protein